MKEGMHAESDVSEMLKLMCQDEGLAQYSKGN